MEIYDRQNSILLAASEERNANQKINFEEVEVDTSCSYVPFGFVHLKRMPLKAGEVADGFWSFCISIDEYFDVLFARFEPMELKRLESVLSVIRTDVERVEMEVHLFDIAEVQECYYITGACESCCGCVLLIRTVSDAIYVHWHRES